MEPRSHHLIEKMTETHEVVEFGEPFHSKPLHYSVCRSNVSFEQNSHSRFIMRTRGGTDLSSRGRYPPLRGPPHSSARGWYGWGSNGPRRATDKPVRNEIHVLPLSSYDAETTKAEVRIPSDSVTTIAFRKDHPGSYIASTTLGIAFVDEKSAEIKMLKRKRLFPHPWVPSPRWPTRHHRVAS